MGKVLATVPIGEGVDGGAAFDPATQLAFASCGDGTTTISRENGGKLTVVQILQTEKERSDHDHRSKNPQNISALGQVRPAPVDGQRRGKMVPGSFKILVFGMNREPSK